MHHGGYQRQAIGNSVIDFMKKNFGPVFSLVHFAFGAISRTLQLRRPDGLINGAPQEFQKFWTNGFWDVIGGAGL